MIEQIQARLGLDGTAFKKGLTSAKADWKRFTSDIGGDIRAMFGFGAAVAGARALGESMLSLKRKAEDLGASVEFIQSIERMAVKFGGTSQDASAAMTKLSETIGSARTESGEAEKKFERFGITLYDVNGAAKSTEDIFKAIANKYAQTSDAALRASMAVEFFGKTGRNINNILGEGADGIDAYTKSMMKLGMISSGKNVQAIAELAENLNPAGGGVFGWLAGWSVRIAGIPARLAGALTTGKSLKAVLDTVFQREPTGGRGNAKSEQERAERALKAQRENEIRRVKEAEELEQIKEKLVNMAFEELDADEKLKVLEAEIVEQREIMLDMNVSELDAAKAQLKIREKELQINKAQEAERKKIAQHVQEEEEAIGGLVAKRWEEATALQARIMAMQGDFKASMRQAMLYTREEFAGANLRGIKDPETRRQAEIFKREVMPREAKAARLRQEGFIDQALAVQGEADKIAMGLSRLQEAAQLKQIQELKEINKNIKEFNELGKTVGLKTIPLFG